MAASFQISGPGPIRGLRVQTADADFDQPVVQEESPGGGSVDQTELARLEAEAFERGRAQGLSEGAAEALAAAEERSLRERAEDRVRLGSLLQELSRGVAEARQRQEESLLLLVSESLSKLVGTIPEHGKHAMAIARQCLETLGSAKAVSVVLHPDDHAELLAVAADGSADPLAGLGVPVRTSPSVGRGGCLVETDYGTLDGSLAGRLEVLREVLCS